MLPTYLCHWIKTIVFDGEKKCNKKEGGPHCTQSNNAKDADKLQTKLCNQALQVKQVHNSKPKKQSYSQAKEQEIFETLTHRSSLSPLPTLLLHFV